MAFSCSFASLSPLLPLSPSPLVFSSASAFASFASSRLPTVQVPRKLDAASLICQRRNASLCSRSLQLLDEEEQDEDDASFGEGSKNKTIKKEKRKRKPRPSFYDQTVDRWSAKITSQRTSFPWQDQKIKPSQTSTPSGTPLITSSADRENSDFVINESSTENGDRSRRRLDLIVEKLTGSLEIEDSVSVDASFGSENGDSSPSLDVDRTRHFSERFAGMPLGAQPVSAPWLHGAKLRHTEMASDTKFQKSTNKSNCSTEDKRDKVGMLDEKFNGSWDRNKLNADMDDAMAQSSGKEKRDHSVDEDSQVIESLGTSFADQIVDSGPEVATQSARGHHHNAEHGDSSVNFIVDKLKDSMDQNLSNFGAGISFNDPDNASKLISSVPLPWERESDSSYGGQSHRKTNTELAEKTIPETELKRLRTAALRMKERMTVGPAGVTEAIVESIHQKWKEDEVVKLRFEGAPGLNMKRAHDLLEMKTGGLVIWRSGRSVVLYRGMTYHLPCVRTYSRLVTDNSDGNIISSSNDSLIHIDGNPLLESFNNSRISRVDSFNSEKPDEGFPNNIDIDRLLDQLGPRFKDWSGRSPLPVDADLLPGVVPGYSPPFRILPYKTRSGLRDREMTYLRRLARTMPPHFALGRNREHQGLAAAIVKLWEKSVIAKLAIKRGVPNTSNERMAEEIKKLTGGVLVSRNKEYIVFYRGNDFATPLLKEALMQKEKIATIHQDEEEVARLRASALVACSEKGAKGPLVAGTLAETVEAKSRWGNPLSFDEREKMKKDLHLAKHVSLVRYLERKLVFAQAKVRKAEKALAKVQKFLEPAELPTDLETVTDEERTLFRTIGLKMRGASFLGKRGVFDGTIENMHLSWKHRELVKILVKRKNFAQVKQIAIALEAESGGVLISLDKTTKGYAIVLYRGKNYQRPKMLKPKSLLTRRQALARSIELQRREALKHHISNLKEKIQTLKTQLDRMEADRELGTKELDLQDSVGLFSDEEIEEEGEEAYLETYNSNEEEDSSTVI